MAIRQAVLLIADIGGYTRFMTVHRVNLAHAQDVVARLLEAIIDASGKFELAKLEGDAAFFYAPIPSWPADVTSLGKSLADIRRAFVARKAEIALDRVCTCDGCVQAADLKLKFVAHVGEVAEQRVKKHRELAGVSVITVHRMLKNSVPVPEYVLLTEPLYDSLAPELKKFGRSQSEALEGIGEVTTWYIDMHELEPGAPPLLEPSFIRRWWTWAKMTWRSIPYFVGTKNSCEGFRNLDDALGTSTVVAALSPPANPAS